MEIIYLYYVLPAYCDELFSLGFTGLYCYQLIASEKTNTISDLLAQIPYIGLKAEISSAEEKERCDGPHP